MKTYKIVNIIPLQNTLELLDESTGQVHIFKLPVGDRYTNYRLNELFLTEIIKAA